MFEHEDRELLKELVILMATIDNDVQAAVTVINDLVTKVADLEAQLAAGAGSVTAADQTALETAVAAGQAAVGPPPPLALSVPDQTLNFALGQPASFQVVTDGGTPPVTFTAADLGNGLTVDAAGLITGTPGTTGTTTVTVAAGDPAGATASGTMTITVA
jgi:hypothetical protein